MTVSAATLTLSSYVGLNAITGGTISGQDHLWQSVRDIITTPIGARVMRRTYGSDVFASIDKPQNAGLTADIVASVAEGVIAWEPRATLQQVVVQQLSAGALTTSLVLSIAGQTLQLEGVA